MAINYTVQEGDCVGSISFNAGFDWHTIWNHPQNAALKAKRIDPNLLQPGDTVYIPDLTLRQVPCATDQRHTFQLKNVPANLQLRLLEEALPDGGASSSTGTTDVSRYEDPDYQPATSQYQPRTNVPYALYIDNVHLQNGTSDDDGNIKVPLYPAAQQGRLILFPGTAKEETHFLQLGGMDPLDEITGMKKRLSNLGMTCDTGPESTPEFEAALSLFQESCGLPITGKPDSATRARLKQEHGG